MIFYTLCRAGQTLLWLKYKMHIINEEYGSDKKKVLSCKAKPEKS